MWRVLHKFILNLTKNVRSVHTSSWHSVKFVAKLRLLQLVDNRAVQAGEEICQNFTSRLHEGTDRPKASRSLLFLAAESKAKKTKKQHLPGHLKTSSSSAPAHYMAAWERAALCQASGRGCSSQATAELPWASGGNQARCVHVCGMEKYVPFSSTLWLAHTICLARLSVPNKR